MNTPENSTNKPASDNLQEINALIACIELMDDQFSEMQVVRLDPLKRLEIASKGRDYASRARERVNQIFFS